MNMYRSPPSLRQDLSDPAQSTGRVLMSALIVLLDGGQIKDTPCWRKRHFVMEVKPTPPRIFVSP